MNPHTVEVPILTERIPVACVDQNRINEKKLTCVICPNSCRMTVWMDAITHEVKIEGYTCPQGKEYGLNEYKNPLRTIITTMRIEGSLLPVVPVRSVKPIPKTKLADAMKIINTAVCKAPLKMGDVLIKNILDTGIDVIACRDMKKYA